MVAGDILRRSVESAATGHKLNAASPNMYVHTQRLQCSSCLVLTHFLLRDYHILPKKELLLSLWVHVTILP